MEELSSALKKTIDNLSIKCKRCFKPYVNAHLQQHQKESCFEVCPKCEVVYDLEKKSQHDCIQALKSQIKELQQSGMGKIDSQYSFLDYFPTCKQDLLDFYSQNSLSLSYISQFSIAAVPFSFVETEAYIFYGQLNESGYFEGFGYLYEMEKEKFYEGQFVNGLKQGLGRSYIFRGTNIGHIYEGIFLNNHYHGKGTYTWPNKDRYEGYFIESLQDGSGIFFYANGSQFFGQFKQNQRCGYGISLQASTGDLYVGQFFNDQSWGQGIFYFSDLNESYAGEWKEGLMDGRGIYTFQDKSVYMGNFVQDKKNGFGVMCNQDDSEKFKVFMNNDIIMNKTIL